MDRFDLEQQIMEAWGTDKDLERIYEHVCEVETLDRDTVANLLLGLQELHHLRGQKLFQIFEALVKNGDIK